METLAPGLWLDANVIDCWGAILNHEESFKDVRSPTRHFFPTGCIVSVFVNFYEFYYIIIYIDFTFHVCYFLQTKQMIDGSLDKKGQCQSFQAQVSAHYKDDIVGMSLKDIDLVKFLFSF